MKKTILVLALVLSLALVGCQSGADKAKDAAEALNAVTLSAEDAVKIFTDKYANINIDDICFEMEKRKRQRHRVRIQFRNKRID